jgi:hypothetical protein
VDRDPADVTVSQLTLAHVQAGADLDPQWTDALRDRARAPDSSGGAVEGRQEAVPGGVHLCTAVPGELAPHDRLVALEQLTPPSVAEYAGSSQNSSRCETKPGTYTRSRSPSPTTW